MTRPPQAAELFRLPYGPARNRAVYDLFMGGRTKAECARLSGLSEGQVGAAIRWCYAQGLPRKGRARKRPAQETETRVTALPQPRCRKRAPARRVLMRGAVFDIECTDFGTEGYAGFLICCCILPLDGDDVQTLQIRYDERGDDRRLVSEIRDALNGYDILIGHNVQSFDLNWLNSRLMFHGMGVLNTALVFDTYQVAKSLAIKTRKGLGNLLDYFGLEGEKTAIYRTSWNDVRSPYLGEFNAAMQDIVYHCEQDVMGNRNLFDVLYPYALAMRANPFKLTKMMAFGWAQEDAA